MTTPGMRGEGGMMIEREGGMRGRPRNQMTRRRRQLLDAYAGMAERGEPIRLAELARRCGLFSYNDARRILNDLVTMGAIKSIGHRRNEMA